MSQPTSEEELALWGALLDGEKPRYAAQRLGIPRRRVEYLCGKWSRRGWYDWGVVHDLGWMVPGANGPSLPNSETGAQS